MANKKADIFLPIYIGDWLSDTMHLTRDEQGGYFMLVLAYWRRQGPLPDDAASLASIVKASLQDWKGTKSTGVERPLNARLRPFFQVHDGFWHHKRVDIEIAKANLNIEQKSRAGRASANARTNSRSTAVPTARQRRGNPSPSPSGEEESRPLGASSSPQKTESPDEPTYRIGSPEFRSLLKQQIVARNGPPNPDGPNRGSGTAVGNGA